MHECESFDKRPTDSPSSTRISRHITVFTIIFATPTPRATNMPDRLLNASTKYTCICIFHARVLSFCVYTYM